MLLSDLPFTRRSAQSFGPFRFLFLLGLFIGFFLAVAPAEASDPEERRLRIAFELTSDGDFDAFVSNVEGLQKNFGELAEITVVASSRGVGLFRADRNAFQVRLAKLADQGVDFVVCIEGMRELEINGSDLMPFARTVRSGYQQIERLKEQGWASVGDGESYVSHL